MLVLNWQSHLLYGSGKPSAFLSQQPIYDTLHYFTDKTHKCEPLLQDPLLCNEMDGGGKGACFI